MSKLGEFSYKKEITMMKLLRKTKSTLERVVLLFWIVGVILCCQQRKNVDHHHSSVEALCYFRLGTPTNNPIPTTSKSLENDILPLVPTSATHFYCHGEALTGSLPSLDALTALEAL